MCLVSYWGGGQLGSRSTELDFQGWMRSKFHSPCYRRHDSFNPVGEAAKKAMHMRAYNHIRGEGKK